MHSNYLQINHHYHDYLSETNLFGESKNSNVPAFFLALLFTAKVLAHVPRDQSVTGHR